MDDSNNQSQSAYFQGSYREDPFAAFVVDDAHKHICRLGLLGARVPSPCPS